MLGVQAVSSREPSIFSDPVGPGEIVAVWTERPFKVTEVREFPRRRGFDHPSMTTVAPGLVAAPRGPRGPRRETRPPQESGCTVRRDSVRGLLA